MPDEIADKGGIVTAVPSGVEAATPVLVLVVLAVLVPVPELLLLVEVVDVPVGLDDEDVVEDVAGFWGALFNASRWRT